MSFLDSLKQATNSTFTENGAVTNRSTLDSLLDFFSQAGAMRERTPEAVQMFRIAYAENPLMALRALFYMRDVRGGQGERDIFRACISEVNTEHLLKNLQHIPYFGRYDDLFSLGTEMVGDFIKGQLEKDEKGMKAGESISLLAKWMPSENTSSERTKALAKSLRRVLGMKPAEYRKRVVALRKYIKLLEQKMSAKDWPSVDYEKIPSQAMRKHTKAFKRNDKERYEEYLSVVEKGEKKIKTSTLYTYEVFDLISKDERTANVMWENLPDYTNGINALVIADVSGSMTGRPMSISVSLALYFAERNQGVFNGYFMTFAQRPDLVKVIGKNLSERLSFIENAHWEGNTDIEAAFDAILDAAVKSGAKGDDMPKVLYIISDMEFDSATVPGKTNFNLARGKFKEAGFDLPHVVFWQVNSRNNQTPATMYEGNVTLISGSSQSTFNYAVEGKTPIESMNDILNSERYSVITI